MKLIYSEIYGVKNKNQGYCLPIIELHYTTKEKELVPKLTNVDIEKIDDMDLYVAYIPFFVSFFKDLKKESIDKLNTLLSFVDKKDHDEYISKKIWYPFLFTSNIQLNQIRKSYITYLNETKNSRSNKPLYKKYNTKSKEQLEVERYFRSRVSTHNEKIAIYQKNIYNELLNKFSKHAPNFKKSYPIEAPRIKDLPILSIMKQGVYGGIMNINHEFEFNNELDLLYTFLDCIFSSDYNYKVKKCKECKNFFITLNDKIKHCPNCFPTFKKLQKQKYENDEIVKIERRVYQLVNAPNRRNEKKEYLNTKLQKKKDLIDGIITENEYIVWLKSHYRTKYK